jgi:hypothetical protein
MRGGWSNDQESRGSSEQNKRAKIAATWAHDFSLRRVGEELRES